MAVRITRSGMGLTVGIIVLALIVLGGLYVAKERGEQARRADALEIAQQNLNSQSETGTITPSIDGNTEESGTSNEGSESTNSSTEESTTESTGSEQSTTKNNQNEQSEGGTTDQSPSELPQTGASDGASLLIVALLAFSIASYMVSHQQLRKNI